MFPEVDTNGCCKDCGKPRVVGDYPKCPHEDGIAEYFQDQIPGGMVIENGVPEPIRVYSHSEAQAIRERNGYSYKEKWCPTPGTDVDPAGVQNNARYQDAKTLQNGAALMLRGSKQAEEDAADLAKLFIPQEDMTIWDPASLLLRTGEYTICHTCHGAKTFSHVEEDGNEYETYCETCKGSGLEEVKHGKRSRA